MTGIAGRTPVFINAAAGTADASESMLREHFGESIDVHTIAPQLMQQAIARAAAAGAPVIGAAGGDGTQRTAAGALLHTDTALLCIPTGTLNTFARRQGIADVEAAAAALREGRIESVAVGTIEDGVFLNTLTFGEYARIVRRRERFRRYVGKWPAAVIATAATLATLRQAIVHLDTGGDPLIRRTPVVWVGLGWGSFPRLLASQERRREPDLEVVVMRSATKLATTATLLRLARGLLRAEAPLRDAQLEVFHTRVMHIERAEPVGSHESIDATADGELLRTRGSARVGILDGALRVVRGRSTG